MIATRWTTIRLWFRRGAFVLSIAAVPQQIDAAQAASDVDEGRVLYNNLCVTCHGFEGAGGEGPPLNRPKLTMAPDEESLRRIIATGIPNRGMPRVSFFSANELRQLASYVRSLAREAEPPVRGDAPKGREVFHAAGCASCHIVKGQGGSFGPVLTDIGRLRGAEYLRQAIVDPSAALPRATLLVPARGFSEFLPVVVVTRDGREVRGARINEDVFTIQVRDAANVVHSFRKDAVKSIQKETGRSLMPGYAGRLSAVELDDLVAYLSSLRGE